MVHSKSRANVNTDYILYGLLLATLALIVSVFRVSRGALFGPLIFGLFGAATGLAIAMICFYDLDHDRVYIWHSLPLMICGALCGVVPGFVIMKLYCNRMRKGWIEVSAVTLLFASIGAVHGWLGGDKREANPPIRMFDVMTYGAIFGLLAGILQWRLGGRPIAMTNSVSHLSETGHQQSTSSPD